MGDRDEDGLLDFREFINYCAEHEKKLWLVFQNLDTNQDGEGRSLVTVNVILDGQPQLGLCVLSAIASLLNCIVSRYSYQPKNCG